MGSDLSHQVERVLTRGRLLLLPSPMATPRYSLDRILPSGHAKDITVLQFSPDGKFLASGSGDGVLLVFSTSTWEPVKRFIDVSSLNALVWHPVIPKTLICGYASGDVHTTLFESYQLVRFFSCFIANHCPKNLNRLMLRAKSGQTEWMGRYIVLRLMKRVPRSQYPMERSWSYSNRIPFVSQLRTYTLFGDF